MSEEVISLPFGYKRCLYLESTGTQYIDTNIIPSINIGAYVKWSLTNIKNYSNVLACLGNSTNNTTDNVFMLPHWNGYNNAYLGGFMSRTSGVLRLENQTAPTLYSIHESRLNYYNNGQAFIDTTLLGSVDNVSENLENDLPLYLFGCNKLNALSTVDSMIGRIYRAIITEGETIKMDLIPCLDDNGKPCMYDLVTQTPFYNANAEGDDFRYAVKGKMPSWYKRVAYLESTGTQYIKTGYVPTNTTGLYIDTQDVGSGDTIPMGLRESSSTNTRFFITRQTASSYSAGYGWGTWTEISTIKGSVRYDSTLNWLNDRKSITNNPLFGTIIKNLGELPFTPQYDIWMFGINQGGSHAYNFKGRIYRAKISEGSEVVRDFVPAYDTEQQRPCMYDLVDGRAYYNAGTGEFNYPLVSQETNYTGFCQLGVIGNRLGTGEDGLPPTYKRVNYLQSTGIENIKLPTPNLYETHELFTVVTDCQFLSENKTRMGFIARGGLSWGTDYNNGRNGRLIAGGSGSPFLLDVFGRDRNVVTYSTTYYLTADGKPHPHDTPTGNTTWTQTISVGDKKTGGGNGNGKLPDTWDYGVFSVSYEATTVSYPVRIWSCKCWCDSVSYDLIPCLDDNGRPCMFDRVSRKPFYNSGTGEFLYG